MPFCLSREDLDPEEEDALRNKSKRPRRASCVGIIASLRSNPLFLSCGLESRLAAPGPPALVDRKWATGSRYVTSSWSVVVACRLSNRRCFNIAKLLDKSKAGQTACQELAKLRSYDIYDYIRELLAFSRFFGRL